MDNLVLIGMPACGKSTAGVLLAKTLGFGFIDSDLLIQKRENCLLSELIERKGIEGFIAAERDANCSIQAEKSIISTGGSVIYCDETMQYLKSLGAVIYIRLSYETVYKRLGDIPVSRGVVVRRGENLKDLYEERVPLYEKYADYIVDGEGQTVEQTVQTLYRLYQSIRGGSHKR